MALSKDQHMKCASIIHLASGAAALVGSGMAQVPISDVVLLVPIQIKMITAIGAVFDIEMTESAAKGLFASLSASCVGRAASQVLAGWIPVLGNLINATTAAGLTEAVGWLAVEHFAKKSLGERVCEYFAADSELNEIFSENKEKWKRFWRRTKKFCEKRLENLEEQLRVEQS